MLEAVVTAFKIPDLRRKLLFTLAMLVIFRIIASIPVPGVNQSELQAFIEQNQLLSVLNLFSGSGLSNFSVVALGVYPYITASIIMQLMTPIIPQLNELSMEGQQGRNKINQYTHFLTVPLASCRHTAMRSSLPEVPAAVCSCLKDSVCLIGTRSFHPWRFFFP